MFNTLFYLLSNTFLNNIKLLDTLHVNPVYSTIIVYLSKDFKKCLINKYIKNHHFNKVQKILQKNNKLLIKNHATLPYELKNSLLWQKLNKL